MDKKKLISVIGAVLLAVLGFFLKEDVKGLVCEAPIASEAK